MRQGQDVIEALAAADPLPDAERLTPGDEREAEALLASLLATPATAGAVPRPRRRRRALLAAAAACAAVAAIAALDLLESDAPGTDVVEQAVAAVTRDDSVYHVLQRVRAQVPGSPESGRPVYVESWHSSDGRVHQKLFAASGEGRGELLGDFAGKRRPGRTSGPALRYDPRANTIFPSGFGRAPDAEAVPDLDPFADPGARLRQLEQQGALHLAGTTRFAGGRAYRLVSDSTTRWRGFAFERVEYLVDADTYLPLARRISARVDSGPTYRLFTRYLVYERLPVDARSRGQLDLDPHPGAKCAAGAGEPRDERALGFPNPCPPPDRLRGKSTQP
jgi:hypothetical protein